MSEFRPPERGEMPRRRNRLPGLCPVELIVVIVLDLLAFLAQPSETGIDLPAYLAG
jgi:hypothetical protein